MTARQFDQRTEKRLLAREITFKHGSSPVRKKMLTTSQSKGDYMASATRAQIKPYQGKNYSMDNKISTMFLDRSAYTSPRGATGTSAVTIGENEQIRFSSQISDVAKNYAYIGAPRKIGKDRKVTLILLKAVPAGVDEKLLYKVNWNPESANKSVYFSGVAICKAFEYNAKASGTHAYPAEVVEGQKDIPEFGTYATVTFTLPHGVAAKDPNAPVRVRRTKEEMATAKAAKLAAKQAGKTPSTMAATVGSHVDLTEGE